MPTNDNKSAQTVQTIRHRIPQVETRSILRKITGKRWEGSLESSPADSSASQPRTILDSSSLFFFNPTHEWTLERDLCSHRSRKISTLAPGRPHFCCPLNRYVLYCAWLPFHLAFFHTSTALLSRIELLQKSSSIYRAVV